MNDNTQSDFIQRFLFEGHSVRGQWISLSTSVNELMSGHNYPDAVKKQLKFAALAANLLTETLKFEGRLTLQTQSGGDLKLLLIQANHQHEFRGVARFNSAIENSDDLKILMPGAQMALTIEPKNGKRYQGIVPMHQHSLAENLEDYFQQSEQLPTRIWLFANNEKAVGLMLQSMPGASDVADLDHLAQLAATLSEDEALSLASDTILHRLFHQDPLRLFPSTAIKYSCGCSREKSSTSLSLVPKEELHEILREEGKVELTCEFCQTQYVYDSIDVEQVLANSGHDMNQSTGKTVQ